MNLMLKSFLIIYLISLTNAGWFFSDEVAEEKKPEPEIVKLDTNEDLLNKHNDRVVNEGHDHKLSSESHFTDTNHDGKFEHNSEYDHEAFLGKDEVEKFKSMTPEESKNKLGKIINKIDVDKSGIISLDELKEWIKNSNMKNVHSDVEEAWKIFENNSTLDEYLDLNYGALESWSEEEKKSSKEEYEVYLKMLERDKKKFKAADQDKDGKLSKKEYTDFLHPEESPAMRDIVINETLEDMDGNQDGVIDIEEFIKDFYHSSEDDPKGSPEPDWVKQERANFKITRDTNKDNVLDREELANWILPNDFDKSLSEAQHLIYEADSNKDGKLSKEEIIENYSVFVASTATNYGADIYEHEDL